MNAEFKEEIIYETDDSISETPSSPSLSIHKWNRKKTKIR
jgi:hypothetical protein